jgi:uncharacterized membrane protein
MSSKSTKIITNAISAVLAIGLTGTCVSALAETAASHRTDQNLMPTADAKDMEKCYGIAKKDQNDCGTASHGCAGESKIDGDKTAWLFVPTGTCNKIVGGSTKSG